MPQDPEHHNLKIPKKHFPEWLEKQSNIAIKRMKYDLAKESLPYITILLALGLIGLFYREALIGIGPVLLVWLIRMIFIRRNKKDKKDKDDDWWNTLPRL